MAIADILKAQGLDEDTIKAVTAVDPKVVAAFDKLVSEAEAAKTAAAADAAKAAKEREEINIFWNTTATPEMNKVYSENATLKAEAEFYKTQAEAAKESGFVPKEAPSYIPPQPAQRQADGRFAAGANEVPGSPKYMTQDLAMDVLASTAYLLTEHQRLFNEPLPDLRELVQEAGQRSTLGRQVSAKQVWEDKYKVADRRAAIAAEAKAAERAQIEKEVTEKVTREMAERGGSNPNTRTGSISRFSKVAQNQPSKGDRPTWQLPEAERRKATREQVHQILERGRVN